MDGQILIRDKAKSDCVTKWFTLTKKRRIRHDPVEMTIPTNSGIHPLIRYVSII